jgi:hypothetical protein
MLGKFNGTGVVIASCILITSPFRTHAESIGFTVGNHFNGSNINVSGFIPPDPDGAIGPDQFVELINGAYTVYDRSGAVRARTSLDQFWRNAGVTLAGNFTGDPRIIYDQPSGRWFASSLDGTSSGNRLLVGVSNDANPLDGWKGFSFQAAPGTSADFDMLGVNQSSVYISANLGSTLAVLPKADLIAGSIANRTVLTTTNTGGSLQPAVSLDNTDLPHPLLSDFNTPAGFNKISLVTAVGPPATIDTNGRFISIQSGLGIPVNAPQPGTNALIEVIGDTRFGSSVVLTHGNIWGVQTVLVDGRDALHWVRIDASTYALKEQGMISSPSLYYYYGSIAVDAAGDVAIGFSGSSSAQFAGAFAVVGKFDGTTTTFNTPALLQAGAAPYTVTSGTGRIRWGDYSATTVDPTNPNHLWTIQEYASGPDQWSTYVAELIPVPEPSSWVLGLWALGAGAVIWRRSRRLASGEG